MVWGLEKLWPSGQSTPPSSNPSSQLPASASTAPVVSAKLPPQAPQAPTPSSTTTLSPAVVQQLQNPTDQPPESSLFGPRSRKQFTLFAAGATFLLLSSRLTRRQLRKRALTPPPTFKQNSMSMDISVNGPVEAVEALSIATINVLSFTMMMAGGLTWAFDIASIDDLRRKIRGGLGVDGTGRTEGMIEEEFEEWLATTLDRKKKKEGGVVGAVEEDERVRQWRDEKGRNRTLEG